MPYFRKKPVVIEAMNLTNRTSAFAIREWMKGQSTIVWDGQKVGFLVIPTLEGDHRADIGDWIIRGVRGEFYPCKPDIFDATYEPAEATP